MSCDSFTLNARCDYVIPYSLIRDGPEIQISEILLSEFCPVSEDWWELAIPTLAEIFLIKCY